MLPGHLASMLKGPCHFFGSVPGAGDLRTGRDRSLKPSIIPETVGVLDRAATMTELPSMLPPLLLPPRGRGGPPTPVGRQPPGRRRRSVHASSGTVIPRERRRYSVPPPHADDKSRGSQQPRRWPIRRQWGGRPVCIARGLSHRGRRHRTYRAGHIAQPWHGAGIATGGCRCGTGRLAPLLRYYASPFRGKPLRVVVLDRTKDGSRSDRQRAALLYHAAAAVREECA